MQILRNELNFRIACDSSDEATRLYLQLVSLEVQSIGLLGPATPATFSSLDQLVEVLSGLRRFRRMQKENRAADTTKEALRNTETSCPHRESQSTADQV